MHQFDNYCESVILELDSTMAPPVSGQQVTPATNPAPVDPSLTPATPNVANMNINDPNHPVQAFAKTLTTLPPEKQQEYLQKLGAMLKIGNTSTATR